MTAIRVSIACSATDRTRPLLEKRVEIAGVELEFFIAETQECFRIALREQRFAVTEFSMGTHLLTTARGDAAYTAIPVFLSRQFRHSAIYVRTDRGIAAPSDLAGRRIGIPEYQQTAALWVRGMLASYFKVDLSTITWRTGGLDAKGQGERTPLEATGSRRIVPIGPDDTLNALFESGEIDAIISPRPPPCFVNRTAPVARLFADVMIAEQNYYRDTGFFPIMHCLAVRKDVADAHPQLPLQLFRAFCDAKALAQRDLTMTNYMRVALPWAAEHFAAVRKVMGENPWRYGFNASLAELDAMTEYAFLDGLTRRRLDPRELFHPMTLDVDERGEMT